jgi:hypothetical protein
VVGGGLGLLFSGLVLVDEEHPTHCPAFVRGELGAECIDDRIDRASLASRGGDRGGYDGASSIHSEATIG